MSRWKIDECLNGYVLTYPRKSEGGVPGKRLFDEWEEVIEYLRVTKGNKWWENEKELRGGQKDYLQLHACIQTRGELEKNIAWLQKNLDEGFGLEEK